MQPVQNTYSFIHLSLIVVRMEKHKKRRHTIDRYSLAQNVYRGLGKFAGQRETARGRRVAERRDGLVPALAATAASTSSEPILLLNNNNNNTTTGLVYNNTYNIVTVDGNLHGKLYVICNTLLACPVRGDARIVCNPGTVPPKTFYPFYFINNFIFTVRMSPVEYP